MKVKDISIEKLTIHPKNPRVLKDNQYKKAKTEMMSASFQWLQPIIINKNHIIDTKFVVISGNQRYSIAHELYDQGYTQYEKLPIIELELEPNSKEEFAVMIKLNKSWGDWDWTELANLNFEMKEFYNDLYFDVSELSKGFQIDYSEIENMINGNEKDTLDINDVFSDQKQKMKNDNKDYNKHESKTITCPFCGREFDI